MSDLQIAGVEYQGIVHAGRLIIGTGLSIVQDATGRPTLQSGAGGAAQPALSNNVGDVSLQLQVGVTSPVTVWGSALTATRFATLMKTGAINGDRIRVLRTGGSTGGPWDLIVQNEALITLLALPNATWADFVYTSTINDWAFAGAGPVTPGSGGGSVPDATTTTKGIIKLAGDFNGTADLPTIAPAKVTYAKIQNVAALRMLGNGLGVPGVVQEMQFNPSQFTVTSGAVDARAGFSVDGWFNNNIGPGQANFLVRAGTTSNTQWLAARAGTVTNLLGAWRNKNPQPGNVTLTLIKNGAGTALSITLHSGVGFISGVGSVVVAPGDVLAILYATDGAVIAFSGIDAGLYIQS